MPCPPISAAGSRGCGGVGLARGSHRERAGQLMSDVFPGAPSATVTRLERDAVPADIGCRVAGLRWCGTRSRVTPRASWPTYERRLPRRTERYRHAARTRCRARRYRLQGRGAAVVWDSLAGHTASELANL